MTEKQRPPVPEQLLRDGIPYWDKFGGCGVTLIGQSAADSFEGARNSYWGPMIEHGFYINNHIRDKNDLERLLPNLYEGELGIVVVIGKLPENSRINGKSRAASVPRILDRAGYGDTKVVLAFEQQLTPEQMEAAGNRGYDVIAPYTQPLDKKFEVGAWAVELAHVFVDKAP